MTLGFSRGRRNEGPPGPSGAVPAFEQWAAAVRPRLVSLARRFLWNLQDAEEVAQEALLLAWRDEGKLADRGARNAWVYRTAINLCLGRRRRRKPEPLANFEPVGRPQAAGGLETTELMERVRTAVTELPARQQVAFVLRDMEELEYGQIAGIMRTTEGSVRLLVHRGREGVRDILLRRWPESFKS